MLVRERAEYPEPDEDEASNEALLHEPESKKCSLSCVPPPQKAVLFCPLPDQVRDLKWWLTKFLRIIRIFSTCMRKWATMSAQKCCSNSKIPQIPVFITTPKVGGTGLNLTAANHAVITEKFWVLNEQRQAFARVVQLGQNRVPHRRLLNTGPDGYGNRASDLHQLSGVAQMGVLHGLMNRPNITTMMIYRILECRQDHMKRLEEQGDFMPSDGEDELS